VGGFVAGAVEGAAAYGVAYLVNGHGF
jgi:hypothetical protein